MFEIVDDCLVWKGKEPTSKEEAWAMTFAKWELLSTEVDERITPLYYVGDQTCGLCLFFIGRDHSCIDCPIRAITGKSSCIGTPLDKYIMSLSPEDASIELEFLRRVYEHDKEMMEDDNGD